MNTGLSSGYPQWPWFSLVVSWGTTNALLCGDSVLWDWLQGLDDQRQAARIRPHSDAALLAQNGHLTTMPGP